MDEVKRLHYFNSQFLIDKDFNDEQTYHRHLRHLHNQTLHSWGIAQGLDVKSVPDNSKLISVTPGVAIDNQGREIILPDTPPPESIDLTPVGAANSVTVTITYQDFFDQSDRYRDTNNYTRTTERPKIVIFGSSENRTISERLEFKVGNSPTDGSVIVLARVKLEGGNVTGITTDASVRQVVSAAIASGAVNTDKLANSAVTVDKLAPAVQSLINAPIVSINSVSASGINVPNRNVDLTSANAITINPDATNKRITIGENHSARTDNPHQTTAAQIDTQGGTNQIVARINAGTGIINAARIDISPTNLAGVSANVTAANLNTLTAGASADASLLHFHSTIPTQTSRYHVPTEPSRVMSLPEFLSGIATLTAPENTKPAGKIPLYLPSGAQLNQIKITTVSAPPTFEVNLQLYQVSGPTSITTVSNLISITATGDRTVALNHTVRNENGRYWLQINVVTAGTVPIILGGIVIDYTLNRLF